MKLFIISGRYGYSIPINGNTIDDEKLKTYLPAKFTKGNEPIKSCQIEAKKAFFSCYKKKDGTIQPDLVITDYDIISTYEEEGQQKEIDTTQLPF